MFVLALRFNGLEGTQQITLARIPPTTLAVVYLVEAMPFVVCLHLFPNYSRYELKKALAAARLDCLAFISSCVRDISACMRSMRSCSSSALIVDRSSSSRSLSGPAFLRGASSKSMVPPDTLVVI